MKCFEYSPGILRNITAHSKVHFFFVRNNKISCIKLPHVKLFMVVIIAFQNKLGCLPWSVTPTLALYLLARPGTVLTTPYFLRN
jgi:hypothetical protein